MVTRPFLCRCPVCRQSDPVPWWARAATADELVRHEALIRAREIAQGIRRESDGETA